MTLFLSTTDTEVLEPLLSGNAKFPGFSFHFGPSYCDGPWDLAVVPVSEFFLLKSQRYQEPSGLLWMPYGPAYLLRTAWARGVWDYLKTPWDRDELEARASRLLNDKESWESQGLLFEVKDGFLVQGDQRVSLGTDEVLFLRALLLRRGVPLSPILLERTIWRKAREPGSRALAMLVTRLRKKILTLGWKGTDPIPADRFRGYRLP